MLHTRNMICILGNTLTLRLVHLLNFLLNCRRWYGTLGLNSIPSHGVLVERILLGSISSLRGLKMTLMPSTSRSFLFFSHPVLAFCWWDDNKYSNFRLSHRSTTGL